MDWVSDTLAVGSYDDVMDVRRLVQDGIRSVLSLTAFPNLAHSDVTWLKFPILDGPGNSPSSIARAVDGLRHLHANHPPVLVHCMEGKSRSVLVVALYLSLIESIPLPRAVEKVVMRRKCTLIDGELFTTGMAALESLAPARWKSGESRT